MQAEMAIFIICIVPALLVMISTAVIAQFVRRP
jgi:putative effector of murein hydrolase LrgA (UPF0299 family)